MTAPEGPKNDKICAIHVTFLATNLIFVTRFTFFVGSPLNVGELPGFPVMWDVGTHSLAAHVSVWPTPRVTKVGVEPLSREDKKKLMIAKKILFSRKKI